MTIHLVNGDMFLGKHDILVNAVNCVGVMGAGVALAVRRDLGPAADAEYFACYQRACANGNLVLGGLNVWDFRPLTPYAVVNFPTMHLPGGEVIAPALRSSMRKLRDYIVAEVALRKDFDRVVSIGMPALGCGIGDFKFSDLVSIVGNTLDGIEDASINLYAPRF